MVAIAAVEIQLGHGLAEVHAVEVVAPFLQVFFAIWWAWMNFTWSPSADMLAFVARRVFTELVALVFTTDPNDDEDQAFQRLPKLLVSGLGEAPITSIPLWDGR